MSDPDAPVEEWSRSQEVARELECLITVGTIAGQIAHEINNPLASIQNAFLLVKDAIPPSHPHYRYVAAIEREIRRIATVTQTFAGSYRPEEDRAVGVAVSTIIGDAVRLAVQSGSVRVELDNAVHDAFPAPAGLLRHAMQQVLDAALRLADRVEPIRVDIRTGVGQLTVRVHYHPATAAAPAAADQFPHRLIAVMGGAIELAQAESGWTEVSFRLPVIAPSERTP